MHKIGQSGGFSGRLLVPLLKTGLSLIGNLLKPQAESVLIPLGLTAVSLATNVSIQKKMFGSGATTLIISNAEMNDIMKIIKSLEEHGLFIKGVSETFKNEAKEQKRGFLSVFLGTVGATFLGNLLTGKRTFLNPPHPLTNFEIQMYYQNVIIGVYSRSNLPKIKDAAYVINLDGFKPIETHWIALFGNGNNGRASYDGIYFDGFGYIIITNIYRIEVYDSIMCGYSCIGLIDFMLRGKSLLDYTNLFLLMIMRRMIK